MAVKTLVRMTRDPDLFRIPFVLDMLHNCKYSWATCLLVVLGLLSFSCSGEVPVALPPFEEKLVLEGYFVAGDTMIVRLDRAINPYLRNVTRQDPNRAVKGAIIQVSNQDTTIRLAENPVFTLGRSGILYSAGRLVEESVGYSITVDYQGFHVRSKCVVLPVTKILSVQLDASFQTLPTSSGERHRSEFDLQLVGEFPPNVAHYLLEVSGKTTSGTLETLVAVPFQIGEITGRNPIRFADLVAYELSYLPTEYVVSLLRIDALYYEYLLAVETQQGEYSSFLVNETTKVPSNIVGGLGIFAGMSRDTVHVVIQ